MGAYGAHLMDGHEPAATLKEGKDCSGDVAMEESLQ